MKSSSPCPFPPPPTHGRAGHGPAEKLRGCEAHSTVILSHVDEDTFRRLGVNLTCEPQYQSKKLYHK